METQYISLDMTPTGVNPCFHISQYDVGRMLGFIVHSGGATVDLDTYTCTVEATRSDGTAITSAVATTDNIGTFEVTPTMSNKADKYRCQLVIVDENSKRIASLPFDMEVTKAAMDENSEAIEEDASLYQQYTEAVQGAIAEANADIQAEENARIAAVSAEATTRANADATLQNNIDTEATARANAITAEATARQSADNTLQGNINSEAAKRTSADSNLQSQINQIIAPSGEAPSAAEVQNARIGADGVTYDTLGNAIRGQVSDLKSTFINMDMLLSEQLRYIPNLFNGKWQNHVIESQNGTVSQNTNKRYISSVDFIPVESGAVTFFNIPTVYRSKKLWIYRYASNNHESGSFINYEYITDISSGKVDVNIPSTTHYILFMIDYGSGNTIEANGAEWVTVLQGYDKPTVVGYDREITSGDLDSIVTAGTYNIDASNVSSIGNLPIQKGGSLVIFPGFAGDRRNVVQMYFTINKHVYYRYVLYTGSVFSEWKELISGIDDNGYLKRIMLTSSIATIEYSNLASNLPINTFVALSKGWVTDMSEFDNGWYSIVTLPGSQNDGATSQRVQIAVSALKANGTAVPQKTVLAIRQIVDSSTIGDWVFVGNGNGYPGTMHYYAFGDSVCWGAHPDGTKSDYAWPEAFGDKHNLITTNVAVKGQGYVSKRYASNNALEQIQTTNITNANLITLAFGINDASNSDVVIGTINDTTEDTVMGAVYRCVNYIYSQTKKVQIVICGTTRQSGTWSTRLAEINEKLKEFAEKYKLAFVDMTECPINQFNGTSSDGLTTDGTHFNDDGYILLGQYMCGQLSKYYGY